MNCKAKTEKMAYIFGKGDNELGDKVIAKGGSINLFHHPQQISDLIHELITQYSALSSCSTKKLMRTRLLKICALSRELVTNLATQEHMNKDWVEIPYIFIERDTGNISFHDNPVGPGLESGHVEARNVKFPNRFKDGDD